MDASRQHRLGLYMSVPFCRSKCTYCNFASGVYPASQHKRYIDRLIADLEGSAEWAERMGLILPRRVDTVYLGGGTPSLLAPELLKQLFATVRSDFDLDPDAEITVECAPGQIAEETLEAFQAVGVNRVSLGVQSFNDREAHGTGRLHSRAIVEADLRRLRGAGIDNLNVDLIAGLPGQTFASWGESLSALVDSGVPHASVYMLEVDEDSRLGREMLAGGARYHAGLVPSDDAMAQMYTWAIERLAQAGLVVPISAWASMLPRRCTPRPPNYRIVDTPYRVMFRGQPQPANSLTTSPAPSRSKQLCFPQPASTKKPGSWACA